MSYEIALQKIKKAKKIKETNAIELNLSNLGLKEIPKELFELTNLIQLKLYSNQLTKLPKEIGNLTNLTNLYLSSNQLTELPKEIGNLTNLTNLYLSSNQLTELPNEIGNLINLTQLSLPNNKLTELPNEIGNLTNLTKLYLFNNQLIEFPNKLNKLRKLKNLSNEIWKNNKFLKENKFNFKIPNEIYNKPPFEQIEYILKLQKSKKPLNEAKVLFVGDGGVGKTSIINRLLFNCYNEQEDKTEGIEIKNFVFQKNKEKIKLNFWDFGGQEIMHSTHQFFLTNRSLYILLWDARQEDRYGLVEYWLELIQSFGGDSPILVVTNKIDENSASLDEEFLRNKYKNIKGFHKISCKENWKIDELKKAIKEESLKLPHIRDSFPFDWFEVKDRLESLKKKNIDFIKYDEYIEFCSEKNITEPEERRLLIDILHDLGIILNFRDDKKLKNVGVINPIWVTDGIYKILNSSILLKNRGVLHENDLDKILKNHREKYPESKDIFILNLMKKFELSFFMKNDNFLIAGALPKDTPKLDWWNRKKSLLFRYDYNFLPQSIISRFIVKAHEKINSNYLWLNGVVLKKDNIKALIQADKKDKKIFIYIDSNGAEAREFLGIIRDYFDEIHKTIRTIEAEEMIPLPDNHKIAIPYTHLLFLEKKGELNFVPYKLKKEYNISKLLNNIENQRSGKMANSEKIVINNINSNGDGNSNQAGGSNSSATINNNQNSELDKKLNELIEQINQNQIENSENIIKNIEQRKNDKKSLNDYLIDLLGMGGNIGSIAGGISGVLTLLKGF